MATLAQHNDASQVSGAYKVDISRGRNIGRVSSEWHSRRDDEKFLSLNELYMTVSAVAPIALAPASSKAATCGSRPAWIMPSGSA